MCNLADGIPAPVRRLQLWLPNSRLPRFPHFSVDYHEFPWHPCSHDEQGHKGALKTPRHQEQVSYRHPLIIRDPARERADIPPGGARSRTTQQWDEGGGSGSGSSSIRRFRSGPGLEPGGGNKGTAGQWFGRFRGEFHQKVDGKGRVSIPAGFRRVLENGDPAWSDGKAPEFVIVYGDHRRQYLECYTMEAAAEVDAHIAEMPRGSIERRCSNGSSTASRSLHEIDETGRIVLPQKLRTKIGLDERPISSPPATPSRSGSPKPRRVRGPPDRGVAGRPARGFRSPHPSRQDPGGLSDGGRGPRDGRPTAPRPRPARPASRGGRAGRGVWIDGTFGAGGYSRGLLEAGAERVIAIDRDPRSSRWPRPGRRHGDRLRLVEGTFSRSTRSPESRSMASCSTSACRRCRSTSPSGASRSRRTARSTCGWATSGPTAADIVNSAPRKTFWPTSSSTTARSAPRAASRAPSCAHGRLHHARATSRVWSRAACRAQARPEPPRDPQLPGAPHRGERRVRRAGARPRGAERALRPGGRLAVVSFHSLEDRVVKRFLQPRGTGRRRQPPRARTGTNRRASASPARAIAPDDEIARNPRSRSARLRVARAHRGPRRPRRCPRARPAEPRREGTCPMRAFSCLLSAARVMALAFWAYRENYRTQAVLRRSTPQPPRSAELREALRSCAPNGPISTAPTGCATWPT
jgi:DNA-binding transcriptional regulator/RsmH inhibitor MraZ